MAHALTCDANASLRYYVHEFMIKEVVVSETSQIRQTYLYFLEAFLPNISKKYFKQVFMESYFYFK